MVKDTTIRRKGLADRIVEENRKQRKSLADRIRDSSSITRAKLKESEKILSSSALTHPEETVDEREPSLTVSYVPALKNYPLPEEDVRLSPSEETVDEREPAHTVSSVPAFKDYPLPEKDAKLSPSAEATDERKPSPPVSPTVSSPRDDKLSEKQAIPSDLVLKPQGSANLLWLRNSISKFAKVAWFKTRGIFSLFSSRKKAKLHSDNGLSLRGSINKAFRYAEVHRLREKITNELQEKNQKTVVITSPHDGTGNTFLSAVLAVNAVSFSSMKVLIVDMNMWKPQLHIAFGLQQEPGFTDVVKGTLQWKKVIKDTDLKQLKIMAAGQEDMELARHLNRPNLEDLIDKMKRDFDLIILDTSPILAKNRNNVDPALLSNVCDQVLVEIQGKKTTKSQLDEAFEAITQGGGKVDGIIYNQQFRSLL